MVGAGGIQDILLQNMVPWYLGKQREEGNLLSPHPFFPGAVHKTIITEAHTPPLSHKKGVYL